MAAVAVPTLAEGKISCLRKKINKPTNQLKTSEKQAPKKQNQANLVDKSIFTHEVGVLSEPEFLKEYLFVQTPIPSPSLHPSVQEGACLYGTMQSTCVSSAVLGDFTRCQTPGEPSAGSLLGLDSLSFALQLERQSILPSLHPPYLLSPCWVISQ